MRWRRGAEGRLEGQVQRLLNKDIEQLLNAHGLEAQGLGRSAALTNLSRLVGAWDD